MKDIIVAMITKKQKDSVGLWYYAHDGCMFMSPLLQDDTAGKNSRPQAIGCHSAANDIVFFSNDKYDYATVLIACWRAVIMSKEET